MAMVINHNMMAMNAARNLSTSFSALATNTQRLASGLRGTQSGGTENTQQSGAAAQGAAGQTSGESLAAGSAELAKGTLVNSSDSAAGNGQAATDQGSLTAISQADLNSRIPQSTEVAPIMNISPTSSQQSPDPNMADTGQSALQGLSRMQDMAQSGIEALARSSQSVGALLNTSDGGSGLVKDLNQAIIDQPAPHQAQSILPTGLQMASNMGLFKTVDSAILNLMK